jgi:hypothetical protein
LCEDLAHLTGNGAYVVATNESELFALCLDEITGFQQSSEGKIFAHRVPFEDRLSTKALKIVELGKKVVRIAGQTVFVYDRGLNLINQFHMAYEPACMYIPNISHSCLAMASLSTVDVLNLNGLTEQTLKIPDEDVI